MKLNRTALGQLWSVATYNFGWLVLHEITVYQSNLCFYLYLPQNSVSATWIIVGMKTFGNICIEN